MSDRTLFIDLASHAQSIALLIDGNVVTTQAIESRTGEEHLLPLIEELLAKANCTLKDVKKIATVTGPGGFMSLRVGISLANALSNSLHIPLAGIHLSDLWATRVPDDERCLWVHSTKREQLFVRGLGKGFDEWKEPTLETMEAMKAMINHPTNFVGELIESQQAQLPNLHRSEKTKSLAEVLPTILEHLVYDQKQLQPWYGRGS